MAPLQTPTEGSRLHGEHNGKAPYRDTEDGTAHQADVKRATARRSSLRKVPIGKIGLPALHKMANNVKGFLLLVFLCAWNTLQQAHILQPWAVATESEFTNSGRGVFSYTSTNSVMNFFVYTYMQPDTNGQALIRAYSINGTLQGSFSRPGDECVGVAMLTSTRFVVAPKTTHAYVTIDVQVSNLGIVAFNVNNGRTFASSHSSSPSFIIVEEENTDFVYIGQVAPANWLLRVHFSVNKFSTAGNSNNALRTFNDDVAGFFTMNTLESIDGNTLLVAGSTQVWNNYYSVLTKSNLNQVVNHAPSNMTIASKVEPLDTTSMYMSFEDNTVRKLRIASAAVLATLTLPEFQSSLARPMQFAFLLTGSLSASKVLRVINLSNFVSALSLVVSGSPADNSLGLGELLYRRNQTLGFINKDQKRFEAVLFAQDFCEIPFQLKCTSCSAGRYLTSNSSDFECVQPSEFPVGYGNDSTYMQPCLGSLTSGCTSCPSTFMTCVACNTVSGFYLYPPLAICYTVSTMPDTLGVNNGASPKVVTSCSDSNCLKCASDHTQCTQCKPSWYLKSPSTGLCFQNNIEGFGILISSVIPSIKLCIDSNCQKCFTSHLLCEVCKPIYYQTVGQELQQNSCKLNNVLGFGLQVGTLVKLAPCSVANCMNCFSNSTACTVCEDGYYLMENSPPTVCMKNDKPSFGLKPTSASPASKPLISNCAVLNCLNCFADYSKCTRCSYGLVFVPSENICQANTVPGSGVKLMPDGSYVFAPCETPNCIDCFDDVKQCKQCNTSSHYDLMQQNCRLSQNASSKLSYEKPLYFKVKTGSFEIRLSSVVNTVTNPTNKLSWRLISNKDGNEIPQSEYDLVLAQTAGNIISGRLMSSGSGSIAQSTLILEHKDQNNAVFWNAKGYLDPKEAISVLDVVVVPNSDFGMAGAVAVTQFAALLSTLTMGLGANSGAGGSQLSGMLKIIDSIEYVLYWNGDRIYLSNKFIYFWSKDIMEIFENYFGTPEAQLDCQLQTQFTREGVSCSFLNNYGSQMITLAGLVVAFILVEAISFLSKSLKKRSHKCLLLMGEALWYLNWFPSKFFTAGLMLALLDGSQIEVIRLSVLTFTHFNTTPGMIGAAIVSVVCSSLYVWFGFQIHEVVKTFYMQQLKKIDLGAIKAEKYDSIQEGSPQAGDKEPAKIPIVQKPKLPLGVDSIRQEIFEHFRKPKPGESRLYLYIPLMFLGKSVLTQGFVVVTPSIGDSQIWILAVLETSYVLLLVTLKPYKHWQFLFWGILGSGAISSITVVHILINFFGQGMEFSKKEEVFGYILISLYSVSIVVAIVPGWIDNFKSILSWIKTQRRKRLLDSNKQRTNMIAFKTLSQRQIRPVIPYFPTQHPQHTQMLTTNRPIVLPHIDLLSPRTTTQSPYHIEGNRLPPLKVTSTAQSAKMKAIAFAKNKMHAKLETMSNMSTNRSSTSRAPSNKLKILKKPQHPHVPVTMTHRNNPLILPQNHISQTPSARVGRGSLLHNLIPWQVGHDHHPIMIKPLADPTKPRSQELKQTSEAVKDVKLTGEDLTKSLASLKPYQSTNSVSEVHEVGESSQRGFSVYTSGLWPVPSVSNLSTAANGQRNSRFKPPAPKRVESSVSQQDSPN